MNVENTYILIIEDDKKYIKKMKNLLSLLGEVIIDEGYSETDFYNYFSPGKYNLIILDLRLKSDYEGMKLLEFAMNEDPEAPIIIITGYASVETAIQSLKLGAKDYLEKRYFVEDEKKFTQEFLKKVNKIIIEDKAKKLLETKEKELSPIKPIIGENINIKQLMNFAEIFAEKRTSPVFVVGEFGTEKELFAEYIYKKSKAKGKFMKKIIPHKKSTIYKELIGDGNNQGLIEAARGGVLYIENIFNLDTKSKRYLLDYMNTGLLSKNSTGKKLKVNTQLILSTLPLSPQELDDNEIDRKLYYRVKTTPVVIPALREREDDIPLIAQYFLNALKKEGKTSVEEFSDDVIKYFRAYSWPGNVYELKYVVESSAIRAAINKSKKIKLEHISFEPNSVSSQNGESKVINLDKVLSETFLKYLQLALEKSGGAKLRAYEYLGFNRKQRGTINTRVKKTFNNYPDLKNKYQEVYKLFSHKGKYL